MKMHKIIWEIKFVELLLVIGCSSGLQDGVRTTRVKNSLRNRTVKQFKFCMKKC